MYGIASTLKGKDILGQMWNKKEYALSNIGEAEKKKTNGSKRDMKTKPKWISKRGIS
jgi:hypothetical protein